MNIGRAEDTFLWRIENYSFCWHDIGEELCSPIFYVNDLEKTSFSIRLYPRGFREEAKGYISLFLRRSISSSGPENVSLKFELSILAIDGSCLQSTYCEHTFGYDKGYGALNFVQVDNVLVHRKTEFLPQDTLSVRCKIFRGEGNIQNISETAARTRIGIKQISFLLITESFSRLEPNEKSTIEIRCHSMFSRALTCSLMYFIDDSGNERIMLEMQLSGLFGERFFAKFKLYLVDTTGEKIECGEGDSMFTASRRAIQNLPLALTRQEILNKTSEYLPNGKLSLSCECVFSDEGQYGRIERILFKKPFLALNQVTNGTQNKDIYNAAQKLSACPNVLDDLKSMYNNQILTDVVLKTKTKSFPAHKNLLCARSPIFKAMLTTDMREKSTNTIPVDDLEDDTVNKLLLFLYTDELKNLRWNSAVKLYYAGDKYQIEKLKLLCAFFLADNVIQGSAIELLLLADAHSDCNLKLAAEDFISRHEEAVYSSKEWGKLAQTNPLLVTETMLQKYK